jgi:glutamate synthase domain-containing protein 2/glutamate synthase domain-containing protein 1/glutamate synthase domain-containing protein 3
MHHISPPKARGLYDPRFEHGSCGVGFVCDIKGRGSNAIVRTGLGVLERLSHRGATGADPDTGDGAGILIQTPHALFDAECRKDGIALPPKGSYGTGLVFMPENAKELDLCRRALERAVKEAGCTVIGWRKVPVDSSVIGRTAKETQPRIEQIFIARPEEAEDPLGFERKLYLIRKIAENSVRDGIGGRRPFFYITNLSARTFSYKGLLTPVQVGKFFIDLRSPLISSAICLVHSRYSTNTFPTWDLAQPFRFLAHNGEINTLRGNINWMKARESLLESKLFGKDIEKLKPVIVPGGSDSAAIDNVFELLVLSGRSLSHAMMMLVPSAWERNGLLPEDQKAFYRFHACMMEPWDGPAAIAFTDGTRVGAILDRNGLRPARYIVTKSGMVVMASEVGVASIDARDIERSSRLEPGRIFFINTEEGRIIDDDELKHILAAKRPYAEWLDENLTELAKIPVPRRARRKGEETFTLLKAFGYNRDDMKFLLKPMAEDGKEPVGSMGNHTPHAILSRKPQLIYTYFKQMFAQVTNPPVDPIREECVMSRDSFIGPQVNILDEDPRHAKKLFIREPVLTDDGLEKIRSMKAGGFRTKTISTLFDPDDKPSFRQAIDRICAEAVAAIKGSYSFVILSDRGVCGRKAAMPALLAVGAVHHHLVERSLRTRIGIIAESGEPREVHHFACLFGYGADCVNPYLAYEAVDYLIKSGAIDIARDKAIANYRHAVEQGILKILSKMGISTLRSYRGAQIFEALGIGSDVIEKCFGGAISRIGGASLDDIMEEALSRHTAAFRQRGTAPETLDTGGAYQWRRDGEFNLWNPDTIAALQDAARNNDGKRYADFAKLINDQAANPTTLRSLFRFKNASPVPIEEVEPEEAILRRFATGAMSFGSISKGAHETLAIAMNRIGGKSNTGEGGEDPARFVPLANGDSKRSAIKQVASGRFGVTTNYLINADELQIKIAQGAKPGEGGQLPGHKVSAVIARTRYTTPGVTLISPPPHHDIYSIEDLAELIFDLKNVNPKARISVKLVSEAGVGTVAAGVAKGHADMILISGGDGGTGASPLSSIKHAGLPWELGLAETHQTLVLNDLRSRVRLQTDGQMRTGRDVAIAALLGAEEFGFCTATLIVMGCVMLRHCHLNNCSVGVATQDEILEKKFQGKPEHVVNYFKLVAKELRGIMASIGMRTVDEMVGRADLLEVDSGMLPPKARGLDLSAVVHVPDGTPGSPRRYAVGQDHAIDKVLDRRLIEMSADARKNGNPVTIELPISNTDRAVGAMLSGEVCRQHGEEGVPDDLVRCKFKGTAGQSFGAWLAGGITFELAGMANDYVGKGISGGRIIIKPDPDAAYRPEENIIIGNTTFYGAINGEAYIRGRAGERFCIRNSGLLAVVEGVGDHGCEYMTGGRVVVLGTAGRNFAAGMSGGIAYVLDRDGAFGRRCNTEMVLLEKLSREDELPLRELLSNHYRHTSSSVAKAILDDFKAESRRFVKVIPLEYKRILSMKKASAGTDLSEAFDG